MAIQLSAETEKGIYERVLHGPYGSESEVVATAMKLLERWEEFERNRICGEIQLGLDELNRGEGILADRAFFDGVRQEVALGRQRESA